MNRCGSTLVEVVLAIILLGGIAAGLGRTLADSTRMTAVSRYRTQAQLIGRNTVEQLRAAGPGAAAAAIDTFQVDAAGAEDPQGEFRVEVTAVGRCNGGSDAMDNGAAHAHLPVECTGARATVEYRVVVRYLDRLTNTAYGDSVRYALTLGGTTRHTGEAP